MSITPSFQESIPVVPLSFCGVLKLDLLYASCSFRQGIFFCCFFSVLQHVWYWCGLGDLRLAEVAR